MRPRQFFSDADIARAGEKFLDRSLPKPEWTHAAHFAVTFWLIRHRQELRLETELPQRIRAFNEATGTANTDSGGYHETITQASLAAAKDAHARASSLPLILLLDRLLASPLGDPNWLLNYWSREALFSVAARRHWRPPDLKALPFALPEQLAGAPAD